MKLLMLDCDGVLNRHNQHPNGYCPLDADKIAHLNRILDAVPDLRIVLSSAWRYAFREPQVIATLLCVHGANAFNRVHGCTDLDPVPVDAPPYTDKAWWDEQGHLWRVSQINRYVAAHQPTRWAVLDDLPLNVENLFLCEPEVGLTAEIADAVVRHFGGEA